ncbi:hypothetical protein [Pseudomonas sp. Irchel 3H7]|uniref:hypothetical protein n=1 Tax=Pseudomonas sp. Irchel 3H7 TaxID=2009042 RepID=UPI000BA450CF|nr:hypothetical protein [Pseudomonas sp. Irchel 3H7]
MIAQFIEFMKTVPVGILSGVVASGIALFGVIVASAITLFGVIISNRSNTNRLILQLNHDTSEKSKERISKLRHEVYLKVAEDIEGANINLSTLVNRDLASLDMNLELQSIISSIAKLKLVAEPNTTKLAGELSAQFGALFLKVLPRLIPVQNAKTDIEINDSSYVTFSDEASRLIREMQRLHEQGHQDGAILQYLQDSYKINSDTAQEYAAARSLAYNVHAKLMHEFNVWFLPEMKELLSFQLKVMVAIREDLGIACDVADLQRQLERHWAVMEAGYGDVMKDLRRE